jgi:hypothetical protein
MLREEAILNGGVILSENIYKSGSFTAGPEYGRLAGVWVFKEIPWGLDSELSSSCTERIGMMENPIVRFNFKKYHTLLMVNSCIIAPIKFDEAEASKLPKSIGDAILRLTLSVNSISEKEQKDFLKISKPDAIETQ